ncbi:MAG: hypothetical protein H6742_14535 [Alphaproteobacteria bacterium]|nr:hypothetical protein [Alphaproteobacteria bacterium]
MGIEIAIDGGRELLDAVPVPTHPAVPHVGDELVMQPGRWDRHRDFCTPPTLPEAEWRALDAQFIDLYPQVIQGSADPAALADLADAMRLCAPARHDKRPALLAPIVATDVDLADISENQCPDVGMFAAERVFGPFAERGLPQRAWTTAGAVVCFARMLDPWQRPADRFYRDKPRPPGQLRSAVKAVDQTPPMLWRVEDEAMVPLLPLARGFRPGERTVPVGVPDEARPFPVVLGRLVPVEGGGAFVAGLLPLPVVPDVDALMRRLTWELWRMRRHEVRMTWEDLLRERAVVLYRACCEWVWEVLREAPDDAGGGWRLPARW